MGNRNRQQKKVSSAQRSVSFIHESVNLNCNPLPRAHSSHLSLYTFLFFHFTNVRFCGWLMNKTVVASRWLNTISNCLCFKRFSSVDSLSVCESAACFVCRYRLFGAPFSPSSSIFLYIFAYLFHFMCVSLIKRHILPSLIWYLGTHIACWTRASCMHAKGKIIEVKETFYVTNTFDSRCSLRLFVFAIFDIHICIHTERKIVISIFPFILTFILSKSHFTLCIYVFVVWDIFALHIFKYIWIKCFCVVGFLFFFRQKKHEIRTTAIHDVTSTMYAYPKAIENTLCCTVECTCPYSPIIAELPCLCALFLWKFLYLSCLFGCCTCIFRMALCSRELRHVCRSGTYILGFFKRKR